MNIIEFRNLYREVLSSKFEIYEIDFMYKKLLNSFYNLESTIIGLKPKMKLSSRQEIKLNNALSLIQDDCPLQYIIGYSDFLDFELYVNKNVLIPRPDTEMIIEQVIKTYSESSQLQVLDIGTGSGCILLSIIKERPNSYGTGIDVSRKSINVSKINAKQLNLTNRVKFIHSSVDNFNIGKYDLVVSNPPYIELLSLKYLEKDIVSFEPKLALNGGFDGFSKIRKVITKTSTLIKKKGKFILEIGFNQKNKVKEILKEKGFYVNKVIKDYGKNDRCIISTKI